MKFTLNISDDKHPFKVDYFRVDSLKMSTKDERGYLLNNKMDHNVSRYVVG